MKRFNIKVFRRIAALLGLYFVFTSVLYVISGYFFAPKATLPVEPKLLIQVNNDTDWIRGNKEAAVTLVEYCDFQEPTCAQYYSLLKKTLAELKDNVRFVYRHYPVKDSHPQADLAARFTEAAGKQGKFWEAHDLLYEKKDQWEDKENAKEVLIGMGKTLGLDVNAMETDIESEEVKKNVDGDLYGALASSVQAAPTFFLNNKLITLPQDQTPLDNFLRAQVQ